MLAAVGLLAGLLMAVPWISPLAAGLPGLALLGLTALYLFSVPRAMRYIPLQDATRTAPASSPCWRRGCWPWPARP